MTIPEKTEEIKDTLCQELTITENLVINSLVYADTENNVLFNDLMLAALFSLVSHCLT